MQRSDQVYWLCFDQRSDFAWICLFVASIDSFLSSDGGFISVHGLISPLQTSAVSGGFRCMGVCRDGEGDGGECSMDTDVCVFLMSTHHCIRRHHVWHHCCIRWGVYHTNTHTWQKQNICTSHTVYPSTIEKDLAEMALIESQGGVCALFLYFLSVFSI